METTYWNLTNSSNATDELHTSLGSGFTAFIIILSLVLAVIITFDGLIAIMLLLSTLLTVPVRVLLVNLLVICLISAVTALCSFLHTVALSLSDTVQPSLPFCRFSLWAVYITSEARLLGLVALSVTVQRIVTSGMGKLGAKWLIMCLITTWLIAIFSRIDIIIPPIYGVQYAGRVACFPMKENPIYKYEVIELTYFFVWIVLACFLPLMVCICVFIHTLCYIKRHTISEGAQYKKAMAKFAAFLITGNVVNVLGQVVPAIVTLSVSDVIGVYLAYTMYVLSLIPAPILIMVFLKPVHKQLARLLCKTCLKDKDSAPVQQVRIQSGHSNLNIAG